MGHFSNIKGSSHSTSNGRNLGDEWADWDGKDEGTIEEGKRPFIVASAIIVAASIAALFVIAYMIAPRLAGWNSLLPPFAFLLAGMISIVAIVWFVQLILTAITGRNFLIFRSRRHPLFNMVFNGSFRISKLMGLSRDRMGNSFVKVSNTISRAMKGRCDFEKEKLLILLPRCLVKEELDRIRSLKEIYPLHIHVVSGGELARKKVYELRPTAVIGVACERDLVSGIRDVGGKLSVIGLPNQRPDGPCKNTHIDMDELIAAIEFYVGPPKKAE